MANAQRRSFLRLTAGTLALAALPACRDEGPRTLARGERFPTLALPGLDGRTIALPQGPALLINFWATWCGPCRREMPSLQRLSARFRPQDLQVIGISLDDEVNLVKEFQLRYRLSFPLLQGAGRLLRAGLHIPVLPYTYLLTREHRVALAVAGAKEWDEKEMVQGIASELGLRSS